MSSENEITPGAGTAAVFSEVESIEFRQDFAVAELETLEKLERLPLFLAKAAFDLRAVISSEGEKGAPQE
ncbi:hypothetical protein ACFL0Y_03005 [Patescibacteria group bacterium]